MSLREMQLLSRARFPLTVCKTFVVACQCGMEGGGGRLMKNTMWLAAWQRAGHMGRLMLLSAGDVTTPLVLHTATFVFLDVQQAASHLSVRVLVSVWGHSAAISTIAITSRRAVSLSMGPCDELVTWWMKIPHRPPKCHEVNGVLKKTNKHQHRVVCFLLCVMLAHWRG